MRLTLRTLLAYLDDTLEPAQAKIIGQKVAESDQARELMDHIKQVTRRRRITAPPASGPGSKIDPNTIAEYLDGAVSAEQASEVEQVCLASDVHLAEIAACHQILALVLGEPALVPPTAKSRMYGLVKGPESIPFRKPARTQGETDSGFFTAEESNATPFLGGRKWANLILLIGAGIGAAVLLFWTVWHVLNLGVPDDNIKVVQTPPTEPEKTPDTKPAPKENKTSGTVTTPAPKDNKTNGTVTPPVTKENKDKGVKPPDNKENKDPPAEKVKPKEKEVVTPPDTKGDVMPENRFTEADNRRIHLGKYLPPSSKEEGPSIVVWRLLDKNPWSRLWGAKTEVESGCTYVALPGFHGDFLLDRGVQLTLVGNLPEIMPEVPSLESVVDLHVHDSRIDLTLKRGRIVLTSKKDVPAAVRVRFDNPHTPKQAEFADFLLEKGAQVFIDRIGIGFIPPGSHFVKEPDSDKRVLPEFFMGICVAKGNVTLRLADKTYSMTSPPGKAMLPWSSVKGAKVELQEMKELPPFISLSMPPLMLPDKNDQKRIDDVLKAREDLSQQMGIKSIDVALTENLKQKDPSRRDLVIRSYVALGMLDDTIDILFDDLMPDAFFTAIPSLQNWMTSGRDHEYLLYGALKGHKDRFKAAEADKVMELLRGAVADLDLLIEYLDNDNLVIRQIAFMSLRGVPNAPQYFPTMPQDVRMKAQEAYRKLFKKMKEEQKTK
jgi:hypothetical protein